MLRYPRSLFVVMGITAAGFNARHATEIMTAALFCFMILQPAFGALADRIGRRTSVLIYAVLLMIVTVPISPRSAAPARQATLSC